MADDAAAAAKATVLLRLGTPLAKPVDLHAVFKGSHVSDQCLDNLKLMTQHRERVVAVMKALGADPEASAPRQLMAALEGYLPYAGTVCSQMLAAERIKYRVAFPWTSVLAVQPPRKTREVVLIEYATFEEECAYCFAVYGLAHLQAAEELTRAAAAGDAAVASDLIGTSLAGADAPGKEAVLLLRTGAGIFLWLVQVLLPRLGVPRSAKNSSPEVWAPVLSALYHVALGDVQEIAVAEATRRGTTGPGLLGKLHLGASEKYAQAVDVLHKARALDAVNADIVTYASRKRDLHSVLGLVQTARASEADEKWGRAVAVLRVAADKAARLGLPKGTENSGLLRLGRRLGEAAAEAQAELRRVKNDNDRVYYQSEPSQLELPKGMLLQAAREEPYTPPAELDAYFFATDPDKKNSCVVS